MMALATDSFWRRLRYTRLSNVLRGQLDGQLAWRYVLTKTDLPLEIADTISQVVRKTRLWNSEQIDVTSELVAHFQDGLDSGRSAQVLVADFGDIAQAAVLIRRAKKRGRPLWWRALRACCWSLSCFLVVYLLLALYMFTESPAIDTDYLAVVNRLAARTQGEPAWPQYRKAMLALGWHHTQPPQPFQQFWRQTNIATLLDSEEKGSKLREFFALHQPQLADLRAATTAPRLGFTVGPTYRPEDTELLGELQPNTAPDGGPPELIGILLGHVSVLRDASMLLVGDALLAAESNDTQRAYENLVACLRVVQHVQESPFLVSGMVSMASERIAIDAVENILRNHPKLFSDKQLATLAHNFAAIEPPVDCWFESERMLMLDSIQRIYGNSGRVTHEGVLYLGQLESVVSDLGQLGSIIPEERALLGISLPAINMIMASREELFKVYNQIRQQEMSDYSKPLWELTNQESRIDQMLKQSRWNATRYMTLGLLMSGTHSVRLMLESYAGRREGALVGIALELYRREHGDWPESLEQLSPRWLPNVPIDRINGGPLGYRHTADGVVVYSLGSDTDDDNGRPPKKPANHSRNRPYRALPPSPITEETSPSEVAKRDGDWVIWSTVPGK